MRSFRNSWQLTPSQTLGRIHRFYWLHMDIADRYAPIVTDILRDVVWRDLPVRLGFVGCTDVGREQLALVPIHEIESEKDEKARHGNYYRRTDETLAAKMIERERVVRPATILSTCRPPGTFARVRSGASPSLSLREPVCF